MPTRKVKYMGGDFDGQIENVSVSSMKPHIKKRKDYRYQAENSDGVRFLAQDDHLTSAWISCEACLYEQVGKDDNGIWVYQYISDVTIHRCDATTKKGSRCPNKAINELSLCSSHAKKEGLLESSVPLYGVLAAR